MALATRCHYVWEVHRNRRISMTSTLLIIALMLPCFAACSSGTAHRQTTTSAYTPPFPEVVSEKKTTTVLVQPAR
jgi:hypothetical protein